MSTGTDTEWQLLTNKQKRTKLRTYCNYDRDDKQIWLLVWKIFHRVALKNLGVQDSAAVRIVG